VTWKKSEESAIILEEFELYVSDHLEIFFVEYQYLYIKERELDGPGRIGTFSEALTDIMRLVCIQVRRYRVSTSQYHSNLS